MGDAHHCSGPPVSEMTYTVPSGTLGEKKNILLHSYILTVHNMHIKGCGMRFGMGVENHRVMGVPQWGLGAEPW